MIIEIDSMLDRLVGAYYPVQDRVDKVIGIQKIRASYYSDKGVYVIFLASPSYARSCKILTKKEALELLENQEELKKLDVVE